MATRSDNETRILEAAAYLFWTKGYEAAGVNDICATAGIHKGTLYHFFQNKKELALAVIERNAGLALQLMSEAEKRPPRERVMHYLDTIINIQAAQCRRSKSVAGCPFGNFSIEMAGKDEEIRKTVHRMFRKKSRFFAEAVGQLSGVSKSDAKRLGADLFTHWQGAMLMAKTAGNIKPLKTARVFIDNSLRQVG